MSLDQIVKVDITRETTQVAAASFGVGLIVGPNATFGAGELVRTYANMTAVAVDFASTTDEYKAAQKYFGQETKPEKLKIGFAAVLGVGDTMADRLTAIENYDGDWFALMMINNVADNVVSAAAWIETRSKVFATRTADTVVPTNGTTDIASTLKTALYDKTFVIYHTDDDAFAECAWVGGRLQDVIGSSTWKFKTLKGVAVDRLTGTQKGFLESKNCNYYESVAGVAITAEGVVASGEYIDVIIGVEWLKARMAERVFSTLANQRKVPFTNAGINLIVSDVRTQLQIAVNQGLLTDDPAFEVTAPKASEVDSADKLARTLKNVKFTGILAGAVHKVEIAGTVTV